MIVSLKHAGRDFIAVANMIDPRAVLASARENRRRILDSRRRVRRQQGPTLIDQRNAARSEPGRPYQIDRRALILRVHASSQDAEDSAIDDVQIIAWSKAIRRVENVGFAPTDDLLPQVRRKVSLVKRDLKSSKREGRPQQAPIQIGRAS